MTYQSSWISPIAAVEQLAQLQGCSLEQAKRDLCLVLSDGAIGVRAHLGKHAIRPTRSSAVVYLKDLCVPPDFRPDGLDWETSTPVKPWFLRDVPRHHHGPWQLRIELSSLDVAKLATGREPAAPPSAPQIDKPKKKQREHTQREAAREAIEARWPNGAPPQHVLPNANLDREANGWLKQKGRREVSLTTLLRAAGRRKP